MKLLPFCKLGLLKELCVRYFLGLVIGTNWFFVCSLFPGCMCSFHCPNCCTERKRRLVYRCMSLIDIYIYTPFLYTWAKHVSTSLHTDRLNTNLRTSGTTWNIIEYIYIIYTYHKTYQP